MVSNSATEDLICWSYLEFGKDWLCGFRVNYSRGQTSRMKDPASPRVSMARLVASKPRVRTVSSIATVRSSETNPEIGAVQSLIGTPARENLYSMGGSRNS